MVLAGARGSHQGDVLARRDRQVEARQRRRLGTRRISEGHVLERDVAGRGFGQGDRIGGRGDLGAYRQQLHQPLGGPGGPLQLAIDLAQGPDRAGDHDRVEDEGGEIASGHTAADHVLGADP